MSSKLVSVSNIGPRESATGSRMATRIGWFCNCLSHVIECIDWSMGRILAASRKDGLTKRTIVTYTFDSHAKIHAASGIGQ